jgi:hypothetical protein
MEVNVELLLGTNVQDIDGEEIGRIEELLVERDETSCVVQAYLIGAPGLIERLSAWTLVRPIKQFLGTRTLYTVYQVPWEEMDMRDPHHPRLRIAKRDVRHAK